MIQFKRNDTKVEIIITAGVLNYSFSLFHQCQQDYMAELMRERYQNTMEEKLRKIREEAYLDGYRDGRAKRGKKMWFKSWW